MPEKEKAQTAEAEAPKGSTPITQMVEQTGLSESAILKVIGAYNRLPNTAQQSLQSTAMSGAEAEAEAEAEEFAAKLAAKLDGTAPIQSPALSIDDVPVPVQGIVQSADGRAEARAKRLAKGETP